MSRKRRLPCLSHTTLLLLVVGTTVGAVPINAQPGTVSQHPARVQARGKALPLVRFLNKGITVDGKLAEWEPLHTQSSIIQQTLDNLSGPLTPDSKDVAVIKLRYDDEALYAAVRVVDASVVNTFKPEEYFFGDCIELFLDVRPLAAKRGRKLGDTVYSDGVYQLFIVPPTSDGRPLRWKQSNLSEKPIGPITVAGQMLRDGYAVEMRIPFTSLHNVPKARMAQPIGFEIMLDDRDAGQHEDVPQQRVYSWGGLGSAYLDPSRFACAWPGYQNPLPAPGVRAIPGQLKYGEGKRLIKAGLITTRIVNTDREAITLKHRFASSEFDRAPMPKPPTAKAAATESTSTAETNDAAATTAPAQPTAPVQPEIAAATPVDSIDYPQLGVTVYSRSIELKKLPPGRYLFETAFPVLSDLSLLTRYYGRAWGEESSLQELEVEHSPKDLLQSMASASVYIGPSTHYPTVGEPVPGWVNFSPAPRVWWEISERAANNQPPYRLRLEAVRKTGDKAFYSIDIPLNSTRPTPFVIPAGKLSAGFYQITAGVVAPSTGFEPSKVYPISKQVDVVGRTFTESPAVPLVVSQPRRALLETTVRDAPRVLTEAVEVGSPNRERFPKEDAADARARSVWDMHYYQGRIYIGCGEWTDNRGPIDIWSYGPPNNTRPATWQKEFTVDDESVDIIREFDSKLYVPGIDAKEDWRFGTLYTKSRDKWQKKRTIVNGIHVLDVAKWKGKLYVTTGTDAGAALYESSNDGQSWTRRGESWPEGRFYEMAPLRGFLLVMPTQAQQGTYKYQNGKLQRLLIPLFPDLPPNAYPVPQRLQPFGGGVVYTLNSYWARQEAVAPLYFLNDFQRGAVTVEQFKADRVTDVVVRDENCYVLTAKVTGDAVKGAIYTSPDLKAWTRVADFSVPALPQSLEIMNGSFYVGLANRNPGAADAAAGSIWMIKE